MTTTTHRIRCSSLDRFIECPDSELELDNPYNPSNPYAAAGTAKHIILAATTKGDLPDFEGVAREHSLEISELQSAALAARRMVDEVVSWCRATPTVDTEARLGSNLTTGTADYVARVYIDDELAQMFVIDWKTGWGSDEHPNQLRGYALGALHNFGMPSSGYIRTVEAWLPLNERRVADYTEDDLLRFQSTVEVALSKVGSKVQPGPGCRYCPRRLICEDRQRYMRSGTAALTEVHSNKPITREQLGELYDKYKLVTDAVKLYEKMLDEELAEGGDIPLPGGRRLTRSEQKREKIIGKKALPVIAEYFGPAMVPEIVTTSKAAIERAAKEVMPKGKAAGMVRKVNEALRQAEAVKTSTIYRKKVVVDG